MRERWKNASLFIPNPKPLPQPTPTTHFANPYNNYMQYLFLYHSTSPPSFSSMHGLSTYIKAMEQFQSKFKLQSAPFLVLTISSIPPPIPKCSPTRTLTTLPHHAPQWLLYHNNNFLTNTPLSHFTPILLHNYIHHHQSIWAAANLVLIKTHECIHLSKGECKSWASKARQWLENKYKSSAMIGELIQKHGNDWRTYTKDFERVQLWIVCHCRPLSS